MFRIFYAEKDATLYESLPTYNTGIDEVLEVGKRYDFDGTTLLKSRSLLKFDVAEMSASLAHYGKSINDCKFVMQLYTSHAKNLPSDYTFVAKVVGDSWINGTGFQSDISTIGATWNGPVSGSLTGTWTTSSVLNVSYKITGSGEGGSWVSGSASGLITSQSFSYQPTDVNIDVTNTIKLWNNNTLTNNGFLLQFSDIDEANDALDGYVRFFSRETHTIYVPRITAYWSDSAFTTGSLAGVDIDSFIVYSNVKPQYKDTEITKIRVYARDTYPRKSPTNLFPTQTIKHLPEDSYYAVFDALTDETIIPYDDIYTKVSCDSTSNFIYLDMNGFMPERSYRLEFKVKEGFIEKYIDDQIYFKVTR
jgi:hypothetical protein